MNPETRVCQNCKQEFTIEPDDFEFYKKIDVPPPTFCPECRMVRRFSWRNERTLYKRKCNAPEHGEDIVSVYSPDKKFTVYDEKYWWSDAWDPMDYGTPYDFNKSFFLQYREFLERVPLIGLSATNMANCNYCNVAEGDKDSYYISASWKDEHVFYSNRVVLTKDSSDVYISLSNELCYDIMNCEKNFRLLHSVNCTNCSNSTFLMDCVGCQNCFGCVNLRNKQYCIFNVQYSKKEYLKKINEFDVGSYKTYSRARGTTNELFSKNIHRFAHLLRCVNTTGDNCENTKNCYFCFDWIGESSGKDDKFCTWGGYGAKDSYDCGPGVGGGELSYEIYDAISPSKCAFSGIVYNCRNVQYSLNCHSCSYVFACYGLRNKQYCILNRQYTKEEYEKTIKEIIVHMTKNPYIDKGRRVYGYGEFFPIEISPFSYNETIANDYFNLREEEAKEMHYPWHIQIENEYRITLFAKNIPDHIKDARDEITKEIIECLHSGECTHRCPGAFRIIPDELDLYRKLGVSLPRLCPNCRHHERLAKRNPLNLWHRKCMCNGEKDQKNIYTNTISHFHGTSLCPNEFETSYAPERPEIVYCEQCYNAEVV